MNTFQTSNFYDFFRSNNISFRAEDKMFFMILKK